MIKNNIIKSLMLLAIMMMVALVGCENRDDNQNRIEEPIITVNKYEVSEAELRVYFLNIINQYEALEGKDVWAIEDFSGGKTAEETAKDIVLENIVKIKILVSQAKEMGIVIDTETINQTKSLAKDYYNNLEEQKVDEYNITEETIYTVYLDSQFVNLVTQKLQDDYIPTDVEIDESVAEDDYYIKLKEIEPEELLTTLVLKDVVVKKGQVNEYNEFTIYSEEELIETQDKVNAIYDLAISGDDFDTLINLYTEDQSNNNGIYNYPKSKILLQNFSELADLDLGEISNIIETSQEYHIFKLIEVIEPTQEMVSDYLEEINQWEEQVREESIDKLKENALNQIYSEWETEADIIVNSEIWDEISIF